MPTKNDIHVSFVLATYNRVEMLLHTLGQIGGCGLKREEYEICVVDNASSDGTVERVRREYPDVRVTALNRNAGACAKAYVERSARGRYVVYLDDDSNPTDSCIPQMIRHFEHDPQLGAASFTATLPDGRQECSALPQVFIGCGVGFRREVLQRVGGLDPSYFMQAEEYDLSFRLVRAGYAVKTFADLHVLHHKTPSSRQSKRLTYCDTRNNLVLAIQYLPAGWFREYVRDWEDRYGWLARGNDAQDEFERGRRDGRRRGWWRRWTRPSTRLDARSFETLFGFEFLAGQMKQLADGCVRRVLFADLGKNMFAHYRAAKECGIEIVAVMDDRFANLTSRYRGIPVVPCQEGLSFDAAAIVVSNSSPVHARLTEERIRLMTDRPVYRWHGRFDFEK